MKEELIKKFFEMLEIIKEEMPDVSYITASYLEENGDPPFIRIFANTEDGEYENAIKIYEYFGEDESSDDN